MMHTLAASKISVVQNTQCTLARAPEKLTIFLDVRRAAALAAKTPAHHPYHSQWERTVRLHHATLPSTVPTS
jgi:hypothetical protein